MGLDDASYKTVRSNILATDSLTTLNRVYAMLVQGERVKMMAKASEERGLVVGLAMQAENRMKRRGDHSQKSTICSVAKVGMMLKDAFRLWDIQNCGAIDRGMKEETDHTSRTLIGAGRMCLNCWLFNNRTPFSILKGSTPYENRQWDKFASRSRKCVFVGYPFGQKGWKLFDLEKEVFFVSRYVHFVEDIFPFQEAQALAPAPRIEDIGPPVTETNVEEDTHNRSSSEPTLGPSTPHLNDCARESLVETSIDKQGGHELNEEIEEYIADDASEPSATETTPTSDLPLVKMEVPLGRGHRMKTFSARFHDFVSAATIPISSTGQPPSPSKFSVRDECWHEAMPQEICALQINDTWKLKTLLPGKKAHGCKWVYKIKYNSDGTIERFKERLVILENNQVKGLDYNETFSAVVKMVTIHTTLAVAATQDWELHKMDVHNAFLHGDLDNDVYMKLPSGFKVPQQGLVCKLHKSLYGLRQAPLC
ncbi:uncharacterized protein [Arachis hypogaea]|uniref:uncharacterized protein n=1 Tax=Arachis hypogaea TaxID=3818 RepID=UPI003B225193